MKNISEINPITAKQISGEFFLKTPKFFYSDPKYRQVTGNAVKLYTYLRDRLQDFTMRQEAFEEGEWSKSYLDSEGYLYIICDNTELQTVTGLKKDALQAAKKNLEKFGLLRQVRVKDKPNRLYIGAPQDLQENWDYKKEIKQKQAEAKEKKAAEYQEKLKKEKDAQTLGIIGRTENPKHGRAENPTYVGRKTRPSLRTNKTKELKELKELIKISFSLEDIAAREKELKDQFPAVDFEKIKINLLNDSNIVIHKESNYFGLLKKRLELETNNLKQPKITRAAKFTREEQVPEWFYKKDEPQEQQQENAEIAAEREKLLRELGR